jgi:hypothetical protein
MRSLSHRRSAAGHVCFASRPPAVFRGHRLGRVGRTGLVLYFLTSAVVIQGGLLVEGLVTPTLARDPAARHLITHDGVIASATWFNSMQAVAGLLFVGSLLLIGIGLYRCRLLPRAVGAILIADALLLLTPMPELPVLTALLIELPRGAAVAAMGMLMIRTARRETAPAVPATL